MQIDSSLIKLIEGYVGSLDRTANIEALSLYHDLSIYGDDADEFLLNYSRIFGVSISDFCFKNYFPEEGDPVLGLIKTFFTGEKKEYKRFTISDLQEGISNKKI